MYTFRGPSVSHLGGVMAPVNPLESAPTTQMAVPSAEPPNVLSELMTAMNVYSLLSFLTKGE